MVAQDYFLFIYFAISNNILLELEILKMHHVKIKTERLGEITRHTRSPCLVLNRLIAFDSILLCH